MRTLHSGAACVRELVGTNTSTLHTTLFGTNWALWWAKIGMDQASAPIRVHRRRQNAVCVWPLAGAPVEKRICGKEIHRAPHHINNMRIMTMGPEKSCKSLRIITIAVAIVASRIIIIIIIMIFFGYYYYYYYSHITNTVVFRPVNIT